MDRLKVQTSENSSVKARALEEARQMEAIVTESANKAGKAPPKYVLDELIGKGSFGRVYRGYFIFHPHTFIRPTVNYLHIAARMPPAPK